MSQAKKRSLSLETEPTELKKPVKSTTACRPQRPVKRRKTEDTSDTPPQKPLETKVAAKVKRQVWTTTAVDAFFEGLYQHGKHFHQILKHMQNKYKKLNDPTISNLTKNQVRFFYYRTWHKVSALLTDPSHPNPAAGCTVDSGIIKKVKLLSLPGGEEFPLTEGRGLEEEEGEAENPLDSSIEEPELVEAYPKGVGEAADLQEAMEVGSPPHMELELGDKVKDQVESSPGAAMITSTDKGEVKKDVLKDMAVVVNGVRQSLDLVALICYYKLKKKFPGEHNLGKKLSELVYQGTTTVPSRAKGKRRVPIKVPNCRALRAAHKTLPIGEAQTADQMGDQGCDGVLSEPESYTPLDGPQQITVELRPLSTTSWLYVQGLAQNPRLRLTVSSSRTIMHLLQFLALKWQLKRRDAEDSLSLFHTYSKCQSVGASPSLTPISNLHSLETRGGEQTVDAAEESPVVEIPQGVPSQEHCLSSCEVNIQSEGCDLQCENDTDSVVIGTKCLSVPPENDCGSPHTPRLLTIEHTSKGGCVQERFSEPPCSEENSSDNSTQFGITPKQLLVNKRCTLREIHYKFYRPECLQLLYELPGIEVPGDECLHLRTVLQLVEFICDSKIVKHQQSPCKVVNRPSPKIAEYMRTLAKRSPRKSPVSKYWKLKSRSPFKPATLRSPIKRIRLNFQTDSGMTQGDVEQTPSYSMESGPVEVEPQQQCASEELQLTEVSIEREGSVCKAHKRSALRTAFNNISTSVSYPVTSVCTSPVCSQVTRTSCSSSPSLVSVLQMHQHSPEVIQLSKPDNTFRKAKHQPVTVSKSSLESFTNMKLQNLFSVVSESVQQGQSRGKSALSVPNTSSEISGEATITNRSKTVTKPAVPESRNTIREPPFTGAASHSLTTLSELMKVASPVYVTPCCSVVSSSTDTSTVVHSKDFLVPRGSTVTTPSDPIQPMARGTPSFSGPPAVSHGYQPANQSVSAVVPQLEQLGVTSTSKQPPVATVAAHPLLNLASAMLPAIQSAKPVAQTAIATSSPPVVAGLKPFSKPSRRAKKLPNRPGQTRQLVPRPLPFLPNSSVMSGQLSQQNLTFASSTPFPSAAAQPTSNTRKMPPTQVHEAGPSPKEAATSGNTESATPQHTNQLLQNQLVQVLLQTLLLQHQQKSQGAYSVTQTIPPQICNEPAAPDPPVTSSIEKDGKCDMPVLGSKGKLPDLNLELSQGVNESILDNFLAEHPNALDSSSTSKLFHTSSDTVNELLRGLDSRRQDDSIKRLSEETASVLPTFARALDHSLLSTSTTEEPSSDLKTNVTQEDERQLSIPTSDASKGEYQTEASDGNSSCLSFMNENSGLSLSDVLENISDSNFKQFSEAKDVLDEIDFSSVFSHLKGVISTPEKLTQQEGISLSRERSLSDDHPPDSESSIGAILDFLTSPEKDRPKITTESLQVDPTYRSLIEETSVDYIQKFRELASQMNTQN